MAEIPRPDMRMCTLVTSGNVAELLTEGWCANFWWRWIPPNGLGWAEQDERFIRTPNVHGLIPLELM